MVQKIIWTREAVDNLREIEQYIAQDSSFYAERTVQLIYHSTEKLNTHPEIGMVIQRTEKYTLRRILIKSYVLIYCFHLNTIYIVAVYRQGRQLPSGFSYLENYL